jgi:hypothetical protein
MLSYAWPPAANRLRCLPTFSHDLRAPFRAPCGFAQVPAPHRQKLENFKMGSELAISRPALL